MEKKKETNWKKWEIIFELLIFGIVIGIIEDLLAIKLATDQPITLRVVGIIVIVAVPFAFLGEVVFDRIDFAKIFQRIFERKNNQN